MNSPHFFDHLYSIIPLFCSLCPFLFFISLTLLFPPVFPYLHWPSVCLSFRVWIIEVYWVWSADGEMAVMDLSVLFRKCWVYADTCAVKVRRSVAEAPNTTGGSIQGTPKNGTPLPAPVHAHICRCRYTTLSATQMYAWAHTISHVEEQERVNPNKHIMMSSTASPNHLMHLPQQ